MTRSAGRWSPFAALTTSPTATWSYQAHTDRGGERARGSRSHGGGGRGEVGNEKRKEGGGEDEKHRQTVKTQGERETIVSVSGRWEEHNDRSSVLLFIKPFLHQLIKFSDGFLWNAHYILYIYSMNDRCHLWQEHVETAFWTGDGGRQVYVDMAHQL